MKVTVAIVTALLTLVFAVGSVSAQVPGLPGGSVYVVPGSPVPELLVFTISGQTFVAAILSADGRWLASSGSTDGVSGSGKLVSSDGRDAITLENASFSFQLDKDDIGGTFSIVGAPTDWAPFTGGTIQRLLPQ